MQFCVVGGMPWAQHRGGCAMTTRGIAVAVLVLSAVAGCSCSSDHDLIQGRCCYPRLARFPDEAAGGAARVIGLRRIE